MHKTVGRYTLGGPIAGGGMAKVHVGRLHGTGGFTRTVAIKRLHPELAQDRDLVAALLDEARMSACIHHPNVVATLDVVVADEEVFLVLEYVHGESLARLLAGVAKRGERAPIDVVAAIVVGALHGLHAAHEAKDDLGAPLEIVHRDVSPHNILVDTNGNARLLDFGVAKARGRRQISGQGVLKGKVAYMAPEQVHGKAIRASDIFSMGVVLWEALTGGRAFDGQSDGEILAAVLLAKVPSARSIVPSIPEALDEVVRRSLRRRPEDRFPTALAFAKAIEEHVTLAPARVVAEWVQREAAVVLADRERVFAAEEAEATRRDRPWTVLLRSRRILGGIGASVVGVAVIAAGLVATRALGRTTPVAEKAPMSEPAPEPSPSAALAEPEPAPEPSPVEAPSAPEPRPHSARGAHRRCDPPYTLDDKGHKIYKRECF